MKNKRSLKLHRETLRTLSNRSLETVGGGGPTGACTYSGCVHTGCGCDTTANISKDDFYCPIGWTVL